MRIQLVAAIAALLGGITFSASITADSSAANPAAGPADYPAAYQDGFVFLLWGRHFTRAYRDEFLQRIAATGARHITVPVFGCQTDLQSSDVTDCDPADRAFVEETAGLAAAAGFRVAMIPILMTRNWEWRGQVEPSDLDEWFRTYGEWITGIARFSERIGATELIAGTEMNRLFRHEDRWKTLIRSLRAVFPGPILLTVNWDDLEHSFWEEADAIGVSGYFPLSTAPNPSQAELDRKWAELRDRILAVGRRWNKPVHITELGYQSVAGAAATPWAAPAEAAVDNDLQARCFRAFARAWSTERSMVRMNVWATGDLHRDFYPRSFEPLGKPAEQVLAGFFRDRSVLRNPNVIPAGPERHR